MLAIGREDRRRRLSSEPFGWELQLFGMHATPRTTSHGLWDRFPDGEDGTADDGHNEVPNRRPIRVVGPPRAPSLSSVGRGRTPWEIKEGEGEYKMRFDMPGMTRDDVRAEVKEKMLVIKAEKAKKSGRENGSFEEEWSEKSYGRYSCRIALPENVEFDKIKAEVRYGVCILMFPLYI